MNNQSKKTFINLNPTAEKSFETFLESLTDIDYITPESQGKAKWYDEKILDSLLTDIWSTYGKPYIKQIEERPIGVVGMHRAVKDKVGEAIADTIYIPKNIGGDLAGTTKVESFIEEMGHAMQYNPSPINMQDAKEVKKRNEMIDSLKFKGFLEDKLFKGQQYGRNFKDYKVYPYYNKEEDMYSMRTYNPYIDDKYREFPQEFEAHRLLSPILWKILEQAELDY